VIDADLKRCLGQMIRGVQVVAARHDGLTRAYTSHWVSQISFDEPILAASVSPRHDTHPLMIASGRFSVSLLAADQVAQGQYFSYPGRKFRYVAPEYLAESASGWPVVVGCISWLGCEIIDVLSGRFDHDLVFARVVEFGEGRLTEPPLLYSARHGWRVTGGNARQRGESIRDRLLARVAEAEAADAADRDEMP